MLVGTTNQKRSADLKKRKRKALISKRKTYNRRARDYNARFEPATPLPTPSLNEIEGMSITDVFWLGGALTHPDEPWASDVATRAGIKAYLTQRACEEELKRIAREVRQMVKWAVNYQSKVDNAKPVNEEGETKFFIFKSDMKVAVRCLRCCMHLLGELELTNSILRVKALHSGISKSSCRLWLRWNSGMTDIVSKTSKHLEETQEESRALLSQWQVLIEGCEEEWARLVQGPCLTTNDTDLAEENVEHDERDVDEDIVDHNW